MSIQYIFYLVRLSVGHATKIFQHLKSQIYRYIIFPIFLIKKYRNCVRYIMFNNPFKILKVLFSGCEFKLQPIAFHVVKFRDWRDEIDCLIKPFNLDT